MNSMKNLLNIVDDNDKIIGEEIRKNIHQDGLLHREIHVFFITPNKEIIFQHRAKDKDTFADLLDATVGGHVEIGQSYEETAIKETKEETGIKIDASDLIFINKIKRHSEDKISRTINNVFNTRYVYFFSGDINDLQVEEGAGSGFEVWSINKLLNISASDKERFIPYILQFSTTELASFIKNL
jgi:isopentenyl-diphosphate Delta-isomerase